MNQTDARYEQGKVLLSGGHYPEAAVVFEEIVKDMPKFRKAWGKLALTYVHLGDAAAAIRCYDEILHRYPKDAHALYQKAMLEEKTGLLDNALESIDKALKFEPANAEFLYSKGFILFRKKRFNDAISWFDRVLAAEPYHFQAADHKCLCLMTLGVYDELILSCSEYVDRFEDLVHDFEFSDSDAERHENGGELFGKEASVIGKKDLCHLYNYLSFAYIKLGAFRQAEKILRRELEFDVSPSRVYYFLGLVQSELGNFEEAASSYGKSIELEPNFATARLHLNLTLAKAADKELKLSGKNTVFGRSLELYQKAAGGFEQILADEPGNLTALYEIGKIRLALNDAQEAEKAFEDVLRRDPAFVPVYEYLAKMKFDAGDYEAALSLLSDAQTKDPFNYEVMNLTGIIYSKKEDNEFALKCLERAIMLDPAHPKAHYNKALIFMKEERYEEAAASLSLIQKQSAEKNGIPYEKVLNFYATALQNLGKKEEALFVFEELSALNPENENFKEAVSALKNG
ncbi:MAG: tetratricopeptide repeat protein [Methanimicrococcus sp.]|nr:tetratricopeptide repeat protein [Methanimicrococcus sp.]